MSSRTLASLTWKVLDAADAIIAEAGKAWVELKPLPPLPSLVCPPEV